MYRMEMKHLLEPTDRFWQVKDLNEQGIDYMNWLNHRLLNNSWYNVVRRNLFNSPLYLGRTSLLTHYLFGSYPLTILFHLFIIFGASCIIGIVLRNFTYLNIKLKMH